LPSHFNFVRLYRLDPDGTLRAMSAEAHDFAEPSVDGGPVADATFRDISSLAVDHENGDLCVAERSRSEGSARAPGSSARPPAAARWAYPTRARPRWARPSAGWTSCAPSGASPRRRRGGTPGAVRWPDEEVDCAWGKQSCTPDGRRGACVETTARPSGCSGERWYDVDCCVAAGQCCQAMTPLPKPYSVGNCLPVEVSCERDD
jgi:hypothetical protein